MRIRIATVSSSRCWAPCWITEAHRHLYRWNRPLRQAQEAKPICASPSAAVIRGRARGRFFNLVDLVNQLEREKAAGNSGRLAEKRLRHDLIVVDELGDLPFSQSGGQLLFQLISKLSETTSLLITTNLAFVDWPQVFGDSCSATPR